MLHNISIFDHINAALVSKRYFFLKQKILPQRFEFCKRIWTALVTVLTPLCWNVSDRLFVVFCGDTKLTGIVYVFCITLVFFLT